MNELIEDYQRKINSVNELLKDKTNSEETINRLTTKVGCYRSFLTDLKRALNIDIVIWRCTDDITDLLGNTDFTKGMIYEQVNTDKYPMMLIDNYGNESEVYNLKDYFTSI